MSLPILTVYTNKRASALVYGEVHVDIAADANSNFRIGVSADTSGSRASSIDQAGNLSGSSPIVPTGPAFRAGSVVQFCHDLGNGRLWIGVDNVYPGGGDPQAGVNPTFGALFEQLYIFAAIDGSNTTGELSLHLTNASFTRARPARFSSWSGT